MTAWPLVGREAERRRLEAAVTDGLFRGAVIVGEPGVGKTRLAAELLASLRARRQRAEWIVGSPALRAIPYAAIGHLLSIPPSTDGDPVPMARLLESFAGGGPGDSAPVVVIDDAADLDDHSAALVEAACRQAIVSVVMTMRSSSEARHQFVALWKDDVVDRIELEPLDRGETRRFAEAILEGPIESLTLNELWRRSRGNPLYLRELILGGLESGAFSREGSLWRSSTQPQPSTRLMEIIDHRIGRLDRERQRVMEIVAIAGRIDVAVVERIADLETLEALEEARLVSVERDGNRAWVRLAHPIYAEALTATIPASRARRLMGELADALEATGTRRREDLLQRALWRLESGGPTDRGLLVQAAAEALARFDAPLAERLARAAGGDGADAASLLLLGRALSAQQRVDDAHETLEEAAVMATTEDEVASIALARAHLLYFRAGRPEEASAVLVDAIGVVNDAMWIDELRALLVLFQAGAGDLHGVAEAGGRIMARRDARPRTVVHTLVFSSIANVMLGRLEEAERQIDVGMDRVPEARSELPLSGDLLAINRAMARAYGGRIGEALELGSEGRRNALEIGAPEVVGMWSMNVAETLHLAGRIDDALHSMLGALAAARTSDPFGVRGIEAAVASLCATWLGRRDLARQLRREIVDEGLVVDARSRIWFDRATAWLSLTESGAEATARRLAEVARAAIDDTHLVWAAWQLHDAARLGHPDQALPQLTEVADAVEGQLVPTMAHHALALQAGDAIELERAASAFERMGAWLLATEAAAHAQRAYLRQGRSRLARVAAARASMLATRAPGARTPALQEAAPVPLTPRELEIARIAATGLSSREVAGRLGISVRTVDNHLGSIYDKLGIGGRSELGDVIGVPR